MGKKSTPFYEGADHWLLYFNSNGRIEICDLSGDSSPNSKLDPSQMQTHLLNVLRKWRSKEVS